VQEYPFGPLFGHQAILKFLVGQFAHIILKYRLQEQSRATSLALVIFRPYIFRISGKPII